MSHHRLYYQLKPYVPWRLRLAVRRFVAHRKLRIYQDVWPINPAACKPPANWPGWPDGKRFALVLTHDVEGAPGLANCLPLMQLEKELGFRSSFNFIPEGAEYAVPRQLRETLVENGFEVGVHDLYHNGKLFWSRREFAENSLQINHYLKSWGATGFRAGFMLRNLDWLHDLNIQYDASTFDTDPFEPQPEGVNTIFPFWVSSSKNALQELSPANRTTAQKPGYVELPYTMPQDSTLFLVLRQTDIDCWKRKLDWVAEKGGMVLLNTHPDYMGFDPQFKPQQYPVTFYRELLEYIQTKYRDHFCHLLPQETASYLTKTRPTIAPVSGKHICMVSHSAYESDNRIIRYAEALVERGDSVDVLAIKRSAGHADYENLRGVNVYRLQRRPDKNQKGKAQFLIPIIKFWFRAARFLNRHHLWRKYDLIHVHNVPDFLVFTALWPRLTGAKVILDIHDILPEFFASKFTAKHNSIYVRLLKLIEKASARIAHHVIISNHLWKDVYTQRSAPATKCSVFVNQVNTNVFHIRPRTRKDDKLILMFPGGLQWHQGLDIAIEAFAKVALEIPQAEFHIYGDGNMKEQLVAQAKSLGLEQKVLFFEPLPVEQIAELMSNADIGVVPKRADSFGNEAYSTKIMEFMAVGVPVIVSETKIDRFYFKDTMVRFFTSGKVEQLASAMRELLLEPEIRNKFRTNGIAHVNQNNWEIGKYKYLKLVDTLLDSSSNTRPSKPDVKNELELPQKKEAVTIR